MAQANEIQIGTTLVEKNGTYLKVVCYDQQTKLFGVCTYIKSRKAFSSTVRSYRSVESFEQAELIALRPTLSRG